MGRSPMFAAEKGRRAEGPAHTSAQHTIGSSGLPPLKLRRAEDQARGNRSLGIHRGGIAGPLYQPAGGEGVAPAVDRAHLAETGGLLGFLAGSLSEDQLLRPRTDRDVQNGVLKGGVLFLSLIHI